MGNVIPNSKIDLILHCGPFHDTNNMLLHTKMSENERLSKRNKKTLDFDIYFYT